MIRSLTRAGAALAAAALASVTLLAQSPAGAAEPAASGAQANPSHALDRIDQRDLPLDKSYSWNSTASNVRVYLLSSGVSLTHTDFGGRASEGVDLVGGAVTSGCYTVGTGVAGLVAGQKYGVAKEARIVSVRVEDCGGRLTSARVIDGVNWVTRNAVKPAVAVLPRAVAADPAIDHAIKASIASGVTWVVSAGNSRDDFGDDACKYSPARVAEAVTATDLHVETSMVGFLERLMPGANRGPCVDLAAADGTTAIGGASDENPWGIQGGHVGTTAGAAALLTGVNPGWSPLQVHDALVRNATTGKLSPDTMGTPNRILFAG